MNKIDKYLSFYFVLALPFNFILFTWGLTDDPDKLSQATGFAGTVWDTLGFVLILWVLVTFYIILKMVFSEKFRTICLQKLAGFKGRDEREVLIEGQAAKFSFLSTIAILVLFLFLSIVNINVGKYKEKLDTGKTGFISLGLGFDPMKKVNIDNETKAGNDNNGDYSIFTYSGLPFSDSLIMLFLITWLAASYRVSSRKYIREL